MEETESPNQQTSMESPSVDATASSQPPEVAAPEVEPSSAPQDEVTPGSQLESEGSTPSQASTPTAETSPKEDAAPVTLETIVPKVDHKDMLEDLEDHIKHVVATLEADAHMALKDIGAEVDKLKSLANNEIQVIKTKL